MPEEILLDTAPIIAHLRGKLDIVAETAPGTLLFTSLFTFGELQKGIQRADNKVRENDKVSAFLDQVAILLPDTKTAETYGKITAQLDRDGNRIPENDAWIAAVAIECGMTLATRDAHFGKVDDLQVLQWNWD
ncbi:MAG: PIN domain-containing protein [Verrucomicrobiota bacterium]